MAAEEAARQAEADAAAEEAARMAAEEAENDRQARIENARMAIAAAATAEAAQAAYDAVKDEATATEAAALMQAVMDRTAALAMMDRATQQKTALSEAAGDVDVTAFDLTTEAGLAAAEAALAALEMALANAVDVSDADKTMYQLQLDAASAPVTAARNESNRQARIENARRSIAMADTPEAAQAAYDAVKDDATVTEGVALQAAVNARIADLATMGRANTQKAALVEAAGKVDVSDLATDPTQDAVDTAKQAIYALKAALNNAVDVSDADKASYEAKVKAAEETVMTAQGAIDHAAQTGVLANAVKTLEAIDLSNLSTQAAIDAAKAAITGVETALEAATELSNTEKAVALVQVATASRTVLLAQDRANIAGQMGALTVAVKALEAIDLDALMTQDQIDDANKAITALDLALASATDLTAAQKLDATVDVTVAKRRVSTAQTNLNKYIDTQKKALSTAGTELGKIDLDDLSDKAKIDAAQAAVDKLEMALKDATHVSDADKGMYQNQLNMAVETVKTARTGMDSTQRMASQRSAITTAVKTATDAVKAVNNMATDAQVQAAKDALSDLEKAIADADDLPAGDTDVNAAKGTLTALEGLFETADMMRTKYVADKKKMEDEATTKAMAKTGKALHAALGGTPDTNSTAIDNASAALLATGTAPLTIVVAAGAGGKTAAEVPTRTAILRTGDSAGSLGGWAGTDYDLTSGSGAAEVTDNARVYTNKGQGRSQAFSGTNGKYTLVSGQTGANAGNNGYLGSDSSTILDVSGTAETLALVEAADFMHSGTQNRQVPDRRDALYVRGTYDGADGEFRCMSGCSSTNDGKGSPSGLGGTWHFKPDAGAMVNTPDAHYLYYGWWVGKDDDGNPTAASAFAGRVGTDAAITDGLDAAWSGSYDTTSGSETLTGSATYAGHAAGKFAIDNALAGTGNGGHFTADAGLEATFSGDDIGVMGTIDNFRLNDGTEDPGWSVSLRQRTWGTDGAIGNAVDNPATTADESAAGVGTVWSINGNSAPPSGTWGGTMYDETPGDPSTTGPGDGSNIPTTVTGTFYSEFSNIGRLVGGFGANKK